MSLTKEAILDAISEMSVMDVMKLVSMIEEKFGVTANTLSVHSDIPEKSSESVVQEEQTEFNVTLSAIGNNKIPVIKTVRSIIGLGLKEAKDLVESAPVILKESVSKDEAFSIKKSLEAVGASVEFK